MPPFEIRSGLVSQKQHTRISTPNYLSAFSQLHISWSRIEKSSRNSSEGFEEIVLDLHFRT